MRQSYAGYVVGFRESLVSEPSAHALLTEYFSGREESTANYVTTFPDPARFIPPVGVFLVVETSDGDVGCGGVRRLSAGVFEIKHVYLQPRTRGQGLGRALLAELERRAVLLGATRVVLDTNESQVAAAQLYRSTGYVEIEPYNENGNATNWFGKAV
jgi:GNAT superfamily N-acetyltransferase